MLNSLKRSASEGIQRREFVKSFREIAKVRRDSRARLFLLWGTVYDRPIFFTTVTSWAVIDRAYSFVFFVQICSRGIALKVTGDATLV
jgi:hypothetical protein